jgi:predicted O-linked N-acetylglucosamine transferase (SPINDLY family)
MGHTRGARTGIFAQRCAPIQVSYLGYIGTMGAEYIDYLLADSLVIPAAQRQYYAEKVVSLPYCYQANEARTVVSDKPLGRADVGLKDDSFVFCCFNNSYKISPDVFGTWMRLLHQVDGSVLWLLGSDNAAAANLRAEARRRGVAADRLVFAARVDLPEYLARYRLADLFLDTFHYNAGTTASDALWMGLPLLTRTGDTFSSRMAASLLQAIGLPELIADSTAAYEAIALALARNPSRLAALRQRLKDNRDRQPLFDTASFARNLEAAYIQMAERSQAWLPPEDIVVTA